MGRSVSYATGSVVKAYRPFAISGFDGDCRFDDENDCHRWNHDDDDETNIVDESYAVFFDWDDMAEDFQSYAKELWPSLTDCDRWAGREDHILLENELVEMGFSTYCGLACYWVRPRDWEYSWPQDTTGLAHHWCEQIAERFQKAFGNLQHIGTASNGEAFFRVAA